jgi:hypothetical protein
MRLIETALAPIIAAFALNVLPTKAVEVVMALDSSKLIKPFREMFFSKLL